MEKVGAQRSRGNLLRIPALTPCERAMTECGTGEGGWGTTQGKVGMAQGQAQGEAGGHLRVAMHGSTRHVKSEGILERRGGQRFRN